MNHGDVLVIGGTSDARAICQQLDAADVRYTLSVATPLRRAAGKRYPRADTLRAYGVAADGGVAQSAAHPLGDRCLSPLRRGGQPEYCARLRQRRVLLSRYQRPEQLSDLRHPLLHVVGDLNEACAVARRLGERILLTPAAKIWRPGGRDWRRKRCSPGCCRCRRWFSTVAIWGLASGRSSPSAGRSAPNLTPPFIASAGPMLW